MTIRFQSAGRTDIGKVRSRNEDAILIRDDVGLWVVADGLGGHADGDYASGMIVERLGALPRDGSVFDFIESIEDTLDAVNADLRRTAMARNVDIIGSTVVVLVHDKDFMLCGWAGDSRAYCCEDGRLTQITRDHVYGAEIDPLRSPGGPLQYQAGSGALTRAVGAQDSLFVDWVVASNRAGTRFLLCSDGLNKEMSDAELEAVCGHHASPGMALDEVFETSLDRAARDNVSAIIVQLQD